MMHSPFFRSMQGFGMLIRVLLAGIFVTLGFFSFPQISHGAYIENFTSRITVNLDASFSVVEEIQYVFEEEQRGKENHGIYRCIPTIHYERASSPFKERYVDIEFTDVTMDAKPTPFIHEDRGDDECVKIGDPQVAVSGPHTYTISYSVHGAVSYQPSGGADLYWNVTGNGWNVPMHTVVAHVTSPQGILMPERACYRGREGKTDSCDGMSEKDGIYTYRDGQLDPNEGITIAQAVNRSIIAKDVRERYRYEFLVSLAVLFGFLVLGYSVYQYKTKFKTGDTIIPQYEPYPGVKPMYAGLLMDGRLDPRDITACIVYLAAQGFITIKKTERKVLFLFEVDDYAMTLRKDMSDITDEFEKDVADLIFDTNAKSGTTRTLHELKTMYSEAQKNRELLTGLRSRLKKNLKDQGFFMGFNFSKIFSTRFIISLVVLGVAISQISSGVLIATLIGGVIIAVILGEGRRTRKGYEALDHLKGFKEFLSVTERDRFLFHNAPEKSPEQFMEYLPYAIAFGVEKQWAKTFERITIPNPGWYDGGNIGTFNAVALTQSLGSFSTAFANSSGTSPSGGGGSSGGGSGGGGGGSW